MSTHKEWYERKLWDEIKDYLKSKGRKLSDIEWAGSKECWISARDFLRAARRHDKDEVPFDLIIVGKDFCLGRHEINGGPCDGFYSWGPCFKPRKKPARKLRGNIILWPTDVEESNFVYDGTLLQMNRRSEKRKKKIPTGSAYTTRFFH